MPTYADFLNELREDVREAHEALSELTSTERQSHVADFERLEAVLAYLRLVLERTDSLLVSASAIESAKGIAQTITASPAGSGPNTKTFADQLLGFAAGFPAAADREFEQHAREAATNFQRSAAQRLRVLREKFDEEESALTGRIDSLNEALAELRTSFDTERANISQVLTQQTQTFNEAETSRSAAFDNELRDFRARLAELEESSKQAVDDRVAEIRRMEEQSAALVGAIGLAGTAERYGQEVKQERRVANRLRVVAFCLAILAVGIATLATLAEGQEYEDFIGKLAVSVILGGLATYAARQSAHHRRREERARHLQLELTAFGPFIEPLEREQREEERVRLARRTFTGSTVLTKADADEQGPMPLSFVMKRKQRELEEEPQDPRLD